MSVDSHTSPTGDPSAPTGHPKDGGGPSPSGGHGSSAAVWIMAAIVAAIVVAWLTPRVLAGDSARTVEGVLHTGGEVFLRLLKMVVVPLVMSSVMAGVLGLGDVRRLGRPGLATLGFFLGTTLVAVIVGAVLVNVINPGQGFPPELVEQAKQKHLASGAAKPAESVGKIVENLVLMLFTDNLLKSMVGNDLLPLIVFSLVFAGVLTTLGPRARPVADFVLAIDHALLHFVMLLMKFAPLGIFCLVAARFLHAELELAGRGGFLAELRQVAWYVTAVLVGLGIHAFLILPGLLYVFTGRNPVKFVFQLSESLLTAFSTASSTATLPVTMECCVARAGISERATEFVVPLGATVNMNGTALYEACAAIFIAQAIGMELTVVQQLTIIVTATLAAIGAAGIPEAGLVTMVIVLGAVGLPPELMGIIISVDWFLDRFRTAVNVFGDAIGAAVVDRYFAEPIAPPAAERA